MKQLIFLSLLLFIVNFTSAQTQKESLAAATLQGSSWVGFEIGLGESLNLPPVQQPAMIRSFPIHPSLNYSYFIRNRLALFAKLSPGFTLITTQQLNSPRVESFMSRHIGGSIGSRWYPFKPIGLFGEIEYEHLFTSLVSESHTSTGQFQSLGIDVGWTWWFGENRNIMFEVQLKTFATTFDPQSVLDSSSPSVLSLGVKYLLGSNQYRQE